jgi:hypothetical protein
MTTHQAIPGSGTILSRRQLLAAMSTGALATSSGCLGGLQSDPPESLLGWVAVKNYHPDPQRIEVEIERGETTVHRSEHAVPGKPDSRIPGAVLECTWGHHAGRYTLRGRVNDGPWIERSIPEIIEDSAEMDATTDCVVAEGAFGRYGSAEFGWLVQAWCDQVPDYVGGCAFANSNG